MLKTHVSSIADSRLGGTGIGAGSVGLEDEVLVVSETGVKVDREAEGRREGHTVNTLSDRV